MVAIITGTGLGLERSSAWVLGSQGQIGAAQVGRGGDNVYVNAASGNLVLQKTDEMLIGRGPDDSVVRNYDSQLAWQYSTQRKVVALTGTVNTVGSKVTRYAWDGSNVSYAYDATRGAYVAKEGNGAYDTLAFSGTTWTWTEGSTRVVETYDDAHNGRITSSTDPDGNALTFSYQASGLLDKVTTQDGGITSFVYSGTLLIRVVTSYFDAGAGTTKTLTRVNYAYDTSNRLSTVKVDLSPGDNSTADLNVYTTTYTYDGTSTRIASIGQSDGSLLQINYILVASTYRVANFIQTAASGVTRQTSFSYDTTNRITTVTDPLGLATALTYDANGQLTKISAPSLGGGSGPLITLFTYDAQFNVTSVKTPDGALTTYTYDANGNRTSEADGANDVVSRTFSASNQLLTETHYLAPAPMNGLAQQPVTTRFVYDAKNHLRYLVSGAGDVTEYRYNASGQQVSTLQYTASVYDVSALDPATSLSEATLNAWVAGLGDLSTAKRTDTTYDFRGAIASVTAYGKSLATGAGDTSASTEISSTAYVYDSFGNLLSRLPTGAGSAEVFTYDGLGRLVSSTDFTGQSTSVQFNDAATKTVVTLANGLTKTSTYDLAGELIAYSEAGAGVTTATTAYAYDADGRLRMTTDPTGLKSYALYDADSRKVADILPDGTLTEYGYSAAGLLNSTVQYKNKLTATQLASLVDGSGNPAPVTLASVRPVSDAADRWNWRVYDAAHRLVETIDAAGAAIVYEYDGASRLVSSTGYADLLSAAAVTGFKTTAPTSLQLPSTATVNHAPTAANDTVAVLQGQSITFDPRLNDSDADGNTLSITQVGATAHGGVVTSTGVSLTYTPPAGYTGPDSFTYTISDGTVTTTATINVVVSAADRAPVAANDTLTTPAGTALTFDPRSNDSDPDGDALTVSAGSSSQHGGTVFVNANGTITYAPPASYVGSDSFAYSISDGRGGTAMAVVNITVGTQGGSNGFYQPTFRAEEAGFNGAPMGGSSFDVPAASNASALLSTPPAASFSYELTVGSIPANAGFIGVASQAWYDAGANYSTATAGSAHWYVGASFSYGEASGTTATWTGANTTLNPGDVIGVTYSATTRTARVYVNGALIGTLVTSASLAGVQMYPMIGSWVAEMAGSYRATPSAYAANYVLDAAAPNRPPVVANDQVTAYQGATVTFDPRANDSDPDGNALSIATVGATAHGGSVAINGGGTSLTYTPPAGYSGPDSFTYTVSDGHGATTTALVTVTVKAANRVPVAVADPVTTMIGSPITFDPRVNDSDPDGDVLSITQAGATAHGGLVAINGGGTSLTYTPAAGYAGPDSFTYTVFDGQAYATGTVNVTVSNVDRAPIAVNDTKTTAASTALTFDPRGNDSDPDGDPLTVSAGPSSAHGGTVGVNADGTLTYTPVAGYTGSDTFTYSISDGRGGTATAVVNVTVGAAAAPSLAVVQPGTYASSVTIAGATFTVPSSPNVDVYVASPVTSGKVYWEVKNLSSFILAGVTNDITTAYPYGGFQGLTPQANAGVYTYQAKTWTNGTSGYTTPWGTGDVPAGTVFGFALDADNRTLSIYENNVLGRTVALTFGGPYFAYSGVQPGYGDTAPYLTPGQAPGTAAKGQFLFGAGGTVYAPPTGYSALGGAATPPVVANDAVSTLVGVPLTFDPRTNDSDSNGYVLSIATVGATAHGGSVAINGGGTSLTYTPPAGYSGPDSFTYTVSDGHGATTTALVNVTVDRAPVAANDSIAVPAGGTITFDPRANDADADGDRLTITQVGVTAHGGVVTNNGVSLTYAAPAGYSGPDSFTYTVSDGKGGVAVATVTLNVAAPSSGQAPTAAGDLVSTPAGRAITFDPRINDLAAGGGALAITLYTAAAHGQVALNGGTSLTYTPNAGYSGPDSFTYTISDGQQTAVGVVNVNVVAMATRPASGPGDRVSRNFYDADGRLIATLDPEGYLTQTKYDAAGQKIETVQFATATAASLRWGGGLSQLLASVGSSASDIHHWYLYDARGLVRAEIDGEGDLTRYHYSALGDVDQVIAGQKLDPASLLSSAPTLASLPAAPAGAVLNTTSYTRNPYGQVLSEVKTLATGTETTTYTYDNLRRLIGSSTASGADSRATAQQFDGRGRMTGSLSGVGAAALAALGGSPTTAQVAAIYATYGVTYAYDAADRLIARTEANGVDANGATTVYYYDPDGRLAYQVNALGEVTGYNYNTFGQLAQTLNYATRISATGLTGGQITPALTAAIVASAQDRSSSLEYYQTGQLYRELDGTGQQTRAYSRDAFGEVTVLGRWLNAGSVVYDSYSYDRRGLLGSRTQDSGSGGLGLTSYSFRDAFGRVTSMQDAAGRVTSTAYDRAGRTLSSTDALGQTSTFTYDGRGAVLSRTDRTGKTTQYAYTAFDRQVTVTTPEGVVTTRQANAYGQTISVTDGLGQQTTWTYDLDGHVKTVTDGAGDVTGNGYDFDGRLATTTDARGVVTRYAYDAANRVLTRTVDAGGLNLVTAYQYDAKGEAMTVTDPSGVVTSVGFDVNGRRTSVTVDPGLAGHLALTTGYAYDSQGRVLTQTDPDGHVTKFTYDSLDRLTKTESDPAGLDLTTRYAYDAVGNMVAKTDATGAVTRYVYDGDNRQIFAVDAMGGVVKTAYDAEGRITARYGYATAISLPALAALPLAATSANVLANVSAAANDETTGFVYDGDGRLRYKVDANGRPTEYAYDAAGNLVHTYDYGAAIAPATSYSLASVQSQIASLNLFFQPGLRITYYNYDAANRLVFSIDPEGAVTGYAYDANGQRVKTVQYTGRKVSAFGGWTTAELLVWGANNGVSTDRVTRTVYDAAGRAAYSIDGEGYVTERHYDGAGRITQQIRYAKFYGGVDDTVTLTSLKALLPSSPPNTAAVSSYQYDAAGRLTDTFVSAGYFAPGNLFQAMTVQTHMALDAAGRVTDSTVGYGTADAATTHNEYDAAGRMLRQTAAWGSDTPSLTKYSYDGLGRVMTITDGDGYVTYNAYDNLGHLTAVARPFDAVSNTYTQYTYDAFGNLVALIDPRNNTGYFYYDKLNRKILQIDAEGFATATTYSIGDQPVSVTRYANRATNLGSLTTLPTLNPGPKDETTVFGRDLDDRLVSVTDAEGYTESYTLNAFGDRVAVTSRLGGVTNNTFDHRGLLVAELRPVSSTCADGSTGRIQNTYQYDGRGNRIISVEGANLIPAEQRKTIFVYDLLDRRVLKIGDDLIQTLMINPTGGELSTLLTPTEFTLYDQRGNVIESRDAQGARTLNFYDGQNRRTAQVNAVGGLTTWTFDAAGNAMSMRVYGDLVALPANPGGAAPLPVNTANYRETTYAYDRAGRQLTATQTGVRVGYWDPSLATPAYTSAVVGVTTRSTYDAAGNVIQQIDGKGGTTFFFYDKLGRKVAQVDASNYLTTYALDGEGNVLTESRYATALSGVVTVGSDPLALAASLPAPGDNRVTTFTYDRNGRRLTETRLGVQVTTIGALGGYGGTSGVNSTVTYTYDGLGDVLSKTEATGDQTTYAYDLAGRQITETSAAFLNLNGLVRQHQTQTFYDGLDNVVRTWVGAAGISAPATDRVTTYTYGVGGRMATMTDAEGFVHNYAYDEYGRVTKDSYIRVRSDGTSATEAVAYHYDQLGRVDMQGTGTFNGSTWDFSEVTRYRYDAYGDLTGKGEGGLWQETYEYDSAGRMWRSNAGDGVTRIYAYDAAGNQTFKLETQGLTDLATSVASLDGLMTWIAANYGPIGTQALPGQVMTFTRYDARNQAVEVRQPFRELGQGATALIQTQRTYNAFGEVATEFDAKQGRSDYTYNTLGELTLKQGVAETYTDGTGAVHDIKVAVDAGNRSPDTYYYDASGRLVGHIDARGKLTTRQLLAGTGYGGSEALATAEFHPDGGALRYRYDAFYDLRTLSNELAVAQPGDVIDINHTEQRSYDRMGRLTVQTLPTKIFTQTQPTPSSLTNFYAYDGLGRQLKHYNDLLGLSVIETTDYDAQGRVVRTADFLGVATTYAYVWSAGIATTGLSAAAIGGLIKTTTYAASGKSASDSLDYFGRLVAHTDLGGHSYAYTFDKAGRLIHQTNSGGQSAGQDVTYGYYNTGWISSIVDAPAGRPVATSAYTYDVAGNRTTEVYSTLSGGVTTAIENARATYDAQNRMVTFDDSGRDGNHPVHIDYQYTTGGDIRHMYTTYVNPDGTAGAPENYWYAYDSMSRVVVAKGILYGGVITQGLTGVALIYDLAGERATATTTTVNGDGTWTDQVEAYSYDNNGYLKKTEVKTTPTYVAHGVAGTATLVVRAYDIRDTMGRVTTHGEDDGASRNIYSHSFVYDNDSNITHDETYTVQTDGSLLENITDYSYSAGLLSGSTTTSYKLVGSVQTFLSSTNSSTGYVWFDGARQGSITNSAGTTNFTYDANGHLVTAQILDARPRSVNYVTDSQGQVLERWEGASATALPTNSNPIQYYYDFNGIRVGDVGNNGPSQTDYATAINSHNAAAQTGAFHGGASSNAANFDEGYDPINPSSGGEAPTGSTYTARDGDTLRSIAKLFWGDESLWWLIADANGLNGTEALAAGRVLNVPAKVTNIHNKSTTFRVYDPNQAIGDVQPNAVSQPAQPAPPKKKHGCGGIGQILVAIVAVAVAFVAGPTAFALVASTGATGAPLLIAAAALAAAAGNVASQGVGLALGVQSKFSWSGVALAAISGGVTAGVSGVPLLSGSGLGSVVARAAVANVIDQGIGLAVGLQKRFDWTAVAVSAVEAGAAHEVGSPFKSTMKDDGWVALGNGLVSGSAAIIAGEATRSLIAGTDFGKGVLADLPGMIGNTIGNAIGAKIAAQSVEKQRLQAAIAEAKSSPFAGQDASGIASILEGRAAGQTDDPIGALIAISNSNELSNGFLKAGAAYATLRDTGVTSSASVRDVLKLKYPGPAIGQQGGSNQQAAPNDVVVVGRGQTFGSLVAGSAVSFGNWLGDGNNAQNVGLVTAGLAVLKGGPVGFAIDYASSQAVNYTLKATGLDKNVAQFASYVNGAGLSLLDHGDFRSVSNYSGVDAFSSNVADGGAFGQASSVVLGSVALGSGLVAGKSWVGSKLSAAESEALSGTALARKLGAQGEQAVGITGPKVGVRIPGSNQLRFPDQLTSTTLTEVKNVSYQGYTRQLRDYVTYAQDKGLTFELRVRAASDPLGQTRLSGPLADAVRRGDIVLKPIR